MNWLAHVLLSENHIEYQLGNLLADPLKAKVWQSASMRIHEGVKMHLRIDLFTDAHPLVSQSKKILTPRGYLKGVVLDILYDHFLSLHWDRFCNMEREHFLDKFRLYALEHIEEYPQEVQNIINRVVGNRQLESYAHMDGVAAAFERIDMRLSDSALSKDNCNRYIPLIAKHKDELEENFLQFFPELMRQAKQSCHPEDVAHWKI